MSHLLQDVKTTSWYKLGLELTDDEYKMNEIKKSHRNDVEGALKALFIHWLEKCEAPTRQKVIDALKRIGENYLARKLEKMYC